MCIFCTATHEPLIAVTRSFLMESVYSVLHFSEINTGFPDFFVMLFFISPGKHVRHMVTLHTEALQALEAMWTSWHHAVNPESSTKAASIQKGFKKQS